MKVEVTIVVKRDEVLDQLCDCAGEIRELLDKIPEYQQPEAQEIAQRIMDRMKSWIKIT